MSRWLIWWSTWMAVGFLAGAASAYEPRWASEVFVTKEVRERVDATPILQRPNRPLHFYGNTARRIHYRGTALPNGADLVHAWHAVTRHPYVSVGSQLPR